VVTVTNPTPTPIWMNGRMASNDRRSIEVEREVWFELTRESGSEVGSHCVIDNFPPHDEDYVVLKPGSSVRKTYSLRCFDLSPGKYRVIAFYLDGNPKPPPGPPGTLALRDMLVSPQRTLEIKP
jgi:hypothetical protein